VEEQVPVTMAPRARCLECGRRRVLKRGLCRDCRVSDDITRYDAYLLQSIRLDAGRTYRQWTMTPDAPTERLLRRAHTNGDLTEIISMVFRTAFEQGFWAYGPLVAQLQHDLEEDEE